MRIREVKNGVVYYRSTLLQNPHAFSTRHGGVSAAPHLCSLNLGQGRGDDPETLKENYRLFLLATGLPPQVVSASQIHSDKVLYVTEPPAENPQADGFVTDVRDLTLCVKVADCLPILLEDAQAGVVAAVHAGWRGSAKCIVLRAVDEMERRGACRERICAVIGPHIGACCFEVKEDFVAEYRGYLGAWGDRFLQRRQGKIYCDLSALDMALLCEAGVPKENREDLSLCTCCDPETFFSHRASGGMRGTMAAMIARRE